MHIIQIQVPNINFHICVAHIVLQSTSLNIIKYVYRKTTDC